MADTEIGVYLHARPNTKDAHDIFYVGKGGKRRSKSITKGRNVYHRRVVAKHGAENILVGMIPCSSEAVAFDLERGLIKCLRRMGVKLTNMTDGGEGTSGHVRPADQRRAISQRQLAAVAEGAHHTQNPEVLERIREGHKCAVASGTHSSIAKNPMKNSDVASRSLRTRIEKYGRAHFAPSESTKKKILASVRRRIADGTHQFIVDHPMKKPEVVARQREKILGSRKMKSPDGSVFMVKKEELSGKILAGCVFARPRKGE